jgi:hypothetical protein
MIVLTASLLILSGLFVAVLLNALSGGILTLLGLTLLLGSAP